MRTTPRSTRRTSQPSLGKENLGENVTAASSTGRKARHRLSTAELTRLEDMFRQETHPSRQQKKDLASELGMDYKTITIWFQNKRQKLRGQTSFEKEREQHQDRDRHLARTKLDSSLCNVSSPSHNATLKLGSSGIDPGSVVDEDEPSLLQEDHAAHDGVNGMATKAIIKIKPLLRSLNAFTSWSRGHIEQMAASTEATSTSEATNAVVKGAEIDPHRAQTAASAIPVAPAESDTDDEIAEQEQAEQVKEKPIRWKRVRSLEWACERQTKRRKLSKETDVRFESEDVQGTSDSSETRMDSALSLLSLAASIQVGPPKDVVKGYTSTTNINYLLHTISIQAHVERNSRKDIGLA
ncbi:hypothetical protein JVU11DRAFT_4851 [Chiua virens]|nr:hypothetical protein JVU11DRAFT_4851 [Chiua virens]